MKFKRFFCFFIFINLFVLTSNAQDIVQLSGSIRDSLGHAVEYAHVKDISLNTGVVTDKNGNYSISITRGKETILQVSSVGYKTKEITIHPDKINTTGFNIILDVLITDIDEVSVFGAISSESNLVKIDAKNVGLLPDLSGGVESLIKTMPGVASNSELTSQYNVRGGSFDENLVYVNDIEIYRPILVRSGQQEGLSFLNSDMVSSIQFSAGGFESRFGDKMSSVLDIRYNKPIEFAGNLSFSLLGGNIHIEDISKNGKFTYNTGFRYKTSQYVLNTLETKGDYNPQFYDFQTYFTYKISNSFDIDFLGNYALNSYQFIPETRETQFGTVNNSLSLKIYYDGNEIDKFETYLGAFTASYHPDEQFSLKFILSAYTTNEEETYDIQGQYYLNELDRTVGSDTYGDSIMNIGIGTFLNHARNYIDASVYSLAFTGGYYFFNNKIRWGAKYNIESINDYVNQWKMLDSAGYSLPYTGETVELYESARAQNNLNTNKIAAYIQNTYSTILSNNAELLVNYGLRAHYWDFTNELFITPRLLLSYKPAWKKDMLFRFSSGLYYQPAFIKELRDNDGNINPEIKSQKSVHIVLGNDYLFKAWSRPFKLTTEVYYKYLTDIIPYKVDNVQVSYSAENMAKGYALGLDMKINGEFVKGIESWASLSVMQTKEDIEGDSYVNSDNEVVYPGYYSRPTDQLVNFSLYFQDYLPMNPSYSVILSLHYGSSLPFSSPDENRYDQVFRMKPYRRVDIGFSKVLIREDRTLKNSNPLNKLKSMWLSFEVFNLLDIDNTISYMWVKTSENQAGEAIQYAVPNYLTSRRFNLKLAVKF
ncbi:MAG: hypothetical protein A2X13_01845 [Bacteroidetes bacterium GWC2_33_15]|nr:MAG: hypothetical protein A2X10_07780 [Bacteroidetes bacterium GWA2_33_15]OFX52222.1 MAG: hypothetical protein A2X13_01845 [Bacteroidetes bacterium GWC2_33_15]OFX64376.1 MAG: hypothetical protein A2X15_12665 [Bacteroidetes bacterium GWB2_32_14]OFX67781.1 MAG: hypothetical protein A2X14_06490 [Bacteroidetes bacterium GWD2_33_33]HAN19393.1 TonB-dependent receptor [Bacteroidales bacterium]